NIDPPDFVIGLDKIVSDEVDPPAEEKTATGEEENTEISSAEESATGEQESSQDEQESPKDPE
ncbi:MAG: hypothetical protein PHT01_04970, partial [Spirochaetales bacterium]|nr:hypothetical protein [Spirochaetales bacterium]